MDPGSNPGQGASSSPQRKIPTLNRTLLLFGWVSWIEFLSTDFAIKDEDYSSNRKGKRQYLDNRLQRDFFKKVNDYFKAKVDIPRITRGERQELETLISEEALLFAKYLRNEIPCWKPRLVALGD